MEGHEGRLTREGSTLGDTEMSQEKKRRITFIPVDHIFCGESTEEIAKILKKAVDNAHRGAKS